MVVNTDELEILYPQFAWREPLPVSLTDGSASGLACRLCIGKYGLHGSQVKNLYQSMVEFEKHMGEFHGPG